MYTLTTGERRLGSLERYVDDVASSPLTMKMLIGCVIASAAAAPAAACMLSLRAVSYLGAPQN